MSSTRSWVFETRAPVDEFERRLRRVLEERGARVEPAKAHDLVVHVSRDRAFVTLAYHEDGVRLDARVRPGWFRNADDLAGTLLDAGRAVQAELLPEHRNR